MFKTPDGAMKQWDQERRGFILVDASPELESLSFPLLDPVKERLYYFNRERELKMLEIDDSTTDVLAEIDCREIYNAVLISGEDNLIAIQADTDDLLIHNLHTGKTEKVSSEHKARIFPSSVHGSLVMCRDRALHIIDLDNPEADVIRVIFHSPTLKASRPTHFAPNHSSMYHAVGFENGSIALVRAGPTEWREECILTAGND